MEAQEENAEADEGLSLADEIRFATESGITFDRLYALVRAGYSPDFSINTTDALWMRHPRARFKHDTVILHSNGLITSLYNRNDNRVRLDRTDKDGFEEFLGTVPRATWWDKTGGTRANIGGWSVLLFCISIVVFLVSSLTRWWGLR